MSDPLCHRNSVKRRLEEIDETLENLTRSMQDMSDFSLKAKLEHRITSIRLKKEKTQALAAVARSQNLLAEMEILISQNEVNHEIEKLKCFKRIKLDVHNNFDEGSSQMQNNIQAHVDQASQTKKSSTKVKPKKSNDNKKKTGKNSPQLTKDNNKSPELINPEPNSSELKKNRTPPNLNSLFEVSKQSTSSEIKNKTLEKRTPNSNSLFDIKNKSNNSEIKNKAFENRTPNPNTQFDAKKKSNSSEIRNKAFEKRTPNSNSLFEIQNKTTSSEIKNKTFENRTPNPNSQFDLKLSSNANLKLTKTNKKLDNSYKMPLNGQKTGNIIETGPENVCRHSLPAVITQPGYKNRLESPNSGTDSPFRLIYEDEEVPGGADTNDNPHCDMVNNFFRELMINRNVKMSSPIKIECFNTSMNSATTVKLEELLTS